MALPPSQRLLRSLYQVIVNNVLVAIAVSLTIAVILVAAQFGFSEHIFHLHALRPIYLLLAALLPAAAFTLYLVNRSHYVYLVDYACFKQIVTAVFPWLHSKST